MRPRASAGKRRHTVEDGYSLGAWRLSPRRAAGRALRRCGSRRRWGGGVRRRCAAVAAAALAAAVGAGFDARRAALAKKAAAQGGKRAECGAKRESDAGDHELRRAAEHTPVVGRAADAGALHGGRRDCGPRA